GFARYPRGAGTRSVRDGERSMPRRTRSPEDLTRGSCRRRTFRMLGGREQSVRDPADLVQVERLRQAGGAGRRGEVPLLRAQPVPGDEDQPTAKLGEAPLERAVELDAVEDGHLRVGQDQIVAPAFE